MKRTVLNIYNLHKETLFWARYERKKLIIKYLLGSKFSSQSRRTAVLFQKWDRHKRYSIAYQTNVCKRSGNYKRTLDKVGFNRHMLRQHLNVGKVPNLKKLSW
jgi:ribosomal protein S14